MNNKLIDIIYDSIKDKNFYNYDNDKRLKNIDINKFENILGDNVISIKIGNTYYTINCIESFKGSDDNE